MPQQGFGSKYVLGGDISNGKCINGEGFNFQDSKHIS